MNKKHFTLGEVANELGVRYYQIAYALKSGQVEDVAVRVGGRRMFSSDDLARLKEHFAMKRKEKINV